MLDETRRLGPLLSACRPPAADGEAAVAMAGEIDVGCEPALQDYLREVAHDAGAVPLTIDLSAVTFVSVGGVRALVQLARRHEPGVTVVDPPPSFHRVLELFETNLAVALRLPDSGGSP